MGKVKTIITEEQLLNDGWTRSDDSTIGATKNIENRNPLSASEDSDIKLIVHRMYNESTFAILLPDGGMVNFVANTMEDLKSFEKAISFYDPPF